MFTNYFKIAFRNLWRNKSFSAINILGLAIGIATCLVILLFVENELGYDRFNKKADRIYRVTFQGIVQGEKMDEATVMPPVAQTLKAEFPEVQEATRLRNYGKPRLIYNDKSFREDAFAFVDSNFFQVFTIPLIEGDAKSALIEPNTVVISKAVALKYFGNVDPIGKVISFKDGKNAACKVTGLIDKVPVNSHFQFDLFASMSSLPESREPTWLNSNFYTYLVLQQGYEAKRLEAKLPQIIDKYIGPQLFQAMHVTMPEFRAKGNNLNFHLQALTDIHLRSTIPDELGKGGDIRYVYIFGAIALFMLLIACINFMNLSTAGASKRAREVGVRKVLGSLRLQLIRQFLLESIVLTTIAMALAIVLMYMILPLFNGLTGLQLTLRLSEHPYLLPLLLIVLLVTGIFAGSYPAFYLSSFKPVSVLKGKVSSGKKSIGLRSGLVVFQFFISITLIVCTTVVFRQLDFIRHKKLGYNKDRVLVLQDAWMLGKNGEVIRNELRNDPRVISISNSGYLPAGPSFNNNFFVFPGENSSQMIKTLRYDIDENYIPTLGIEIRSGRNFLKDHPSDSAAAILNETAARVLGWGDNAIGKIISYNDKEGARISFTVVGIVKDFHFRSLHELISPMVMVLAGDPGTMIVKLNSDKISDLLTSLKKSWTALGAEEPLTYSFLDDRYNNTYRSEEKVGLILGIFAGLTIFVACLGLFGLAMFSADQRTKEIGIRKVLGASSFVIVNLLSKDFLKLVLLAFIIASPIAWFVMNKWLEDFAYRSSITWWIFGFAALIAILITLFTVSFQAIRAALANPINSLRSE